MSRRPTGVQLKDLTTFLALDAKQISTPARIESQCEDTYLHARQALLADIDAGGRKEYVHVIITRVPHRL